MGYFRFLCFSIQEMRVESSGIMRIRVKMKKSMVWIKFLLDTLSELLRKESAENRRNPW